LPFEPCFARLNGLIFLILFLNRNPVYIYKISCLGKQNIQGRVFLLFQVQGSKGFFIIPGSGFWVQRFRVQGSGFRVQRFRVQGFNLKKLRDPGFWS
jgi:hypothetical protein